MELPTQFWIMLIPIMAIQFSLQAYCVYDIHKSKRDRDSKIVWAVVVLLFQFLGIAAYLFVGRKE